MQKSYLHTILECFSSMDMDGLQLFLKEDYSYQDTTKEVFLNEIENIFCEHKNNGDTELVVYEGKCSGAGCENCGSNGFRFIGNHSKNYLDLIFIMKGDDITDIFDCAEFTTTEYHEEIKNKASIEINYDDLVSFDKTPEYWIKVNSALAAYDELITTRPHSLYYDEMCYWLDKHEFTIKRIADNDFIISSMRWDAFTKLYEKLHDLRKYISQYEHKFGAANNAYPLIKEEKDLIDWMLEHEAMYSAAPYGFTHHISKKGDSYTSNLVESIIFSDSIFTGAFSFILNYKKHHLVVLNKYGIYTEDEISEMIGHTEYDFSANPVYSLKYHLAKRAEAAELGVTIPLHLNGYTEESSENEVNPQNI